MKIGTDIIYIPRLKDTIKRNKTFIKKVYTDKEIEISKNIKDPTNFLATRFAAKEAIIKATFGKYDFNEIEILKDLDGKPLAHILTNKEICIELSLSYDEDYATAMCIVTQKK